MGDSGSSLPLSEFLLFTQEVRKEASVTKRAQWGSKPSTSLDAEVSGVEGTGPEIQWKASKPVQVLTLK